MDGIVKQIIEGKQIILELFSHIPFQKKNGSFDPSLVTSKLVSSSTKFSFLLIINWASN